jgi:chemotaxis methyl-accepting protein methylase
MRRRSESFDKLGEDKMNAQDKATLSKLLSTIVTRKEFIELIEPTWASIKQREREEDKRLASALSIGQTATFMEGRHKWTVTVNKIRPRTGRVVVQAPSCDGSGTNYWTVYASELIAVK